MIYSVVNISDDTHAGKRQAVGHAGLTPSTWKVVIIMTLVLAPIQHLFPLAHGHSASAFAASLDRQDGSHPA